MKILLVSSMYVGADSAYAGLAVHRQAVELVRRGQDVRVLCPRPRFNRSLRSLFPQVSRRKDEFIGLGPKRGGEVGIHVTYIPYPNLPLGVSAGAHAWILKRYLSKSIEEVRASFEFDVVHSYHLFPVGFVAGRLARMWDVPSVVTAVGSDVHKDPYRSRGIRRRTSRTIREATLLCAVSQALADQVCTIARPPHGVRVVPMGVDTTRFAPASRVEHLRAQLGLPRDGVGLCCVGRLMAEKGQRELIRAFEGLAGLDSTVWLALVGDGPLRSELESEVRSRGLKDRIFLAGHREHDEVSAWLKSSDIFVLASHAEGLPNVVLEAMAAGLPVVATDVGGVTEAVQEGVTGFTVPPKAVPPLQAALSKLVGRPELRREMGAAGRERVLDQYSWSRSAILLERCYEEALQLHP